MLLALTYLPWMMFGNIPSSKVAFSSIIKDLALAVPIYNQRNVESITNVLQTSSDQWFPLLFFDISNGHLTFQVWLHTLRVVEC